ncbi:MAG: hypothetical protein LLF96_02430, partial [Eubacteriales bacterium]|nr:hypothetical protein [Eubacteriales bacterium]
DPFPNLSPTRACGCGWRDAHDVGGTASGQLVASRRRALRARFPLAPTFPQPAPAGAGEGRTRCGWHRLRVARRFAAARAARTLPFGANLSPARACGRR